MRVGKADGADMGILVGVILLPLYWAVIGTVIAFLFVLFRNRVAP